MIGVVPPADRRARGYDAQTVDPGNTALLDLILASAGGAGDVAVLDLDGCLFDTRPRQIQIFREYAALNGLDALYRVRIQHFTDWSTANTLRHAGLDAAFIDTHAEPLRLWWNTHFFSSPYVLYDHAMPGAPALVQALHGVGVHVVYLTGRDIRMRRGTETSLKRFGFPLGDRATLIVKPHYRMDDTRFKDGAIETIEGLGRVRLYLDNEPVNVNMYRRRHPDALVVFVETDHSPKPDTPDPEIPWLRSFCRGTGA